MAPFLVVRPFATLTDRIANLVRHYDVPPGFDLSLGSLGPWRAAVTTRWSNIIRGVMSGDGTYRGLEWDLFDEPGSLLYTEALTTGSGGGSFGPGTLPPQTAALVVLRTGAGSPVRTRGLAYLPFLPRAFLGPEGSLTMDAVAIIEAIADLIVQPIVDSLARTFTPNVLRKATGELFPVVSREVAPELAGQRRRGRTWAVPTPPVWF